MSSTVFFGSSPAKSPSRKRFNKKSFGNGSLTIDTSNDNVIVPIPFSAMKSPTKSRNQERKSYDDFAAFEVGKIFEPEENENNTHKNNKSRNKKQKNLTVEEFVNNHKKSKSASTVEVQRNSYFEKENMYNISNNVANDNKNSRKRNLESKFDEVFQFEEFPTMNEEEEDPEHFFSFSELDIGMQNNMDIEDNFEYFFLDQEETHGNGSFDLPSRSQNPLHHDVTFCNLESLNSSSPTPTYSTSSKSSHNLFSKQKSNQSPRGNNNVMSIVNDQSEIGLFKFSPTNYCLSH